MFKIKWAQRLALVIIKALANYGIMGNTEGIMPRVPTCFCGGMQFIESLAEPSSSWVDIQQLPDKIQVKESARASQEIGAKSDYRFQVCSKRARTLGVQTHWSQQKRRLGEEKSREEGISLRGRRKQGWEDNQEALSLRTLAPLLSQGSQPL